MPSALEDLFNRQFPTGSGSRSPSIRPGIQSNFPGGVMMSRGPGFTDLYGPNGQQFGSSNVGTVASPSLTGNTPLAQAYESAWMQADSPVQSVASSPVSGFSGGNLPGASGKIGTIGGIDAPPSPVMISSPGSGFRSVTMPGVTSLATERAKPFFSDGTSGSTTLMSSGGLDRGGDLNEAKRWVDQQDYNQRIDTLAKRNVYRDVAGGGDGRPGRGGGSNRIWAGAPPARETIDQRVAKAGKFLAQEDQAAAKRSEKAASMEDIFKLMEDEIKKRYAKN